MSQYILSLLKIWCQYHAITTVVLRVWKLEKLTRKVVFLFSLTKWNPQKIVAIGKWGRPTVGLTNWPLEGLQTDNELTSYLAGRSVQCGVDQTKNPTVNSPHLTHSTRRRVVLGAIINTESTSLVSFSFSFPSRQAVQLERLQRSRIPTPSLCSIVDGCLSMLIVHSRWHGRAS